MKKLLELKRKRAALVKKMRSLHDAATSEDRDLSEEEEKEYGEIKSDVEAVNRQITREEELLAVEEDSLEPEEQEERSTKVLVDKDEADKEQRLWNHLGEQLSAVYRASMPGGRVDERLLRAASGMSEGVATDGGFLVQSDFSAELLKKAIETGVVAPRVRKVSLSGNGIKINAVNETSRAEGSRWGGVKTYWENEADSITASHPKLTQLEWKLKKLTGLCYATDELLEDSSALGQVINEAFGEEFSFKIDDAIIRGTGAGQPLGILNGPCLISQAKLAGQTAATVVADNITKMRARLWARSRANSVWLINQDVEPYLHTLNFAGDSGKSDIPVYLPANGLSGQPYDTLYGRPVIPIEQASTVGSVGDVILADLSQYLLTDKKGGKIKSDVSIHVRFIYDESCFRFILRLDGQPLWPSAVTPAQGSNTQSPFVAIAVRA